MSNTLYVYRVFRLHARQVWSCALPEQVAVRIQESDFETLKYMFSQVPPYVFTKRATPFLAKELITWWDNNIDGGHDQVRDNILSIIEAYPASYHHAATQEMGIGFGLNDSHWLTWPTLRWVRVGAFGRIEHDCLSETELKSRKKNRNGRPKGVPDNVWRRL